jgi:cytosine/adenosine deaminase-related metal-dependent hydrolase
VSSKILLVGGCVLTLGARTSNLKQGDVLIDGDVIAEVAPSIRARDAEAIDATDTIIMPGFVDTHRHTWTSLFRNLGADGSSGPPTDATDVSPDDVYAATLIGLLGAAEAGITTVVDWSPLRPGDPSVDAALRAHADSGLRTVFVVSALPGDEPGGALPRLREAAGQATTIAVGSTLSGSPDLDAIAAEWGHARESGMRVHAHADPDGSGAGVIARLAERGLLGDDVTLLHRAVFDDSDIEAIASSNAAVSLAPVSEMAGGLGSPPIQRLIDRGIRPGLAVDDERVAPGDLFAQMRATISIQHATVFDLKLAGKAGLPKLMSTRDVIRHATSDGARVAGLGGQTGSLEPGMQADVIVLRTDRPNIFPVNDPIGAVVWGMDTSNVDHVLVGGQAVMRSGALVADVAGARSLAAEARARVAEASDPVVEAASGGAA